ANSPDLNPIETFGRFLKDNNQNYEEWELMSVFEEVIASMPREIDAVKANGAPTKY
ncbi:5168_t:CDS:2, partial [Ambispora gerdemannii]